MLNHKILFSLTLLVGIGSSMQAQQGRIAWPKKTNHLIYYSYEYGEKIDSTEIPLALTPTGCIRYYDPPAEGRSIPGMGRELEITDYVQDSTSCYIGYDDSTYYSCLRLSRSTFKWDTILEGSGRTRYVSSINSNKIELLMDESYGVNATPVPHYGLFKGVLTEFRHNGQLAVRLSKAEIRKTNFSWIHSKPLRRVSARQLDNIRQQHLVVSTRIFDDVQLSWGKENSRVEGNPLVSTPFDSVLHFGGGTLALKRVQLPALPRHYQSFLELHQRSNGDAYDRTGSVFVIPVRHSGQTFLQGVMQHPDSLPIFSGRDGQHYQGIVSNRSTDNPAQWDYQPPVELMRFFTSFGIGQYNDRVHIDGIDWEEENYYKQEVTDLSGYLQGEVWIGIWIGNYDAGGHRVTLDLKSYPNTERIDGPTSEGDDTLCQPLFNTCNVLEMAGQNYGRLFASDSLTVRFWIDSSRHQRLRYLATGHGGWDGGDEFNPKVHTLLIDGKPTFTYTPWRSDCGRYREWNPVSGNSWNGTSSSDYSRSGWCPGTATQPVYFDLAQLAPGWHTLTLSIPQGTPLAGSFSHWCVSAVIVQ